MFNLKDGRESSSSRRLLAIISRRRLHQEQDIQQASAREGGEDFLSPLAKIKKVSYEQKQEQIEAI